EAARRRSGAWPCSPRGGAGPATSGGWKNSLARRPAGTPAVPGGRWQQGGRSSGVLKGARVAWLGTLVRETVSIHGTRQACLSRGKLPRDAVGFRAARSVSLWRGKV